MTITDQENPQDEALYTIQTTKDRGRAVYATQLIPAATAIHVASKPFASVIKEDWKKEVCAWCFKYRHCKRNSVQHPDMRTGVSFCSKRCLQHWTEDDFDGRMEEVLVSMNTKDAQKALSLYARADYTQLTSTPDGFPFDQAKLVASAVVARSREQPLADGCVGVRRKPRPEYTPSWDDVLNLQPGIFDDKIDLAAEVRQVWSFLSKVLPKDLQHLIHPTAYPFLSRHLSNSFGIWELPIMAESENLGSAMYPSASYFNHSCDPNVMKVRLGREVIFVTSREVQSGEELCISYGHTEKEVEERRSKLLDWWGFNCNCSRCERELNDKSIEVRQII
jgi:SET domain